MSWNCLYRQLSCLYSSAAQMLRKLIFGCLCASAAIQTTVVVLQGRKWLHMSAALCFKEGIRCSDLN